jgi:hypothetical protein
MVWALAMPAGAQVAPPGRLDLPEPLAVAAEAIAPLFLPKVFADAWALQEYVRSGRFEGVRRTAGDLFAVDTLFREALRLSWGSIYEALLICLAATVEHRRVGLSLPLIGPIVWIPLTGEFPDAFEKRVAALPGRLYNDSPEGAPGDGDKLQHFFGSAFLAALLESRESSERVGSFVEWGEEQFVVGGVSDNRDMMANWQGQEFGLRLLSDRHAVPSSFLRSTGAGDRAGTTDSTIQHPTPP